MANTPLIFARVNITVKDINNNSVAKQFNSVLNMNFDYNDATLMILDQQQGSFYFGISKVTSFTCTINGNTYTFVMS